MNGMNGMNAGGQRWGVLLLAAWLLGGCASPGGVAQRADGSQVIDIKNTVIQGTDIRIINILHGVAGVPEGSYSDYREQIDTPQVTRAKADLRIEASNSDQARPDMEPTLLGWRATIDYQIRLRNLSPSQTYTVSGTGVFGGICDGKFIRSDSGRVRSNTLRLPPGATGYLRFSGQYNVQDIFTKAHEKKLGLNEQMIQFVPPNDGAVWRPNWPDTIGLVGLTAAAESTLN